MKTTAWMKRARAAHARRSASWRVGGWIALSVAALAISLPSAGHAQAAAQLAASPSCQSVSAETCALAQQLGRGINMGNMLDAPQEGDWGVRLEAAYIDRAAALFSTVRLPVRWSNHAQPTADATLDEFFAARVDAVVDALLARGLYVILDMHHYSQLFGDRVHPREFTVPPDVVEARFLSLWRQIALRYKDRSPKLVFELLNEPHGKLDSAKWNALLVKGLREVRASNPSRTVIVGPTEWNAVKDLPKLELPADRNLIVTIHNYEPFFFTHQGASYLPMKMPLGVTCCDDVQKKMIDDAFDSAKKWGEERGYPIYLGEFGATSKADPASRENYIRFARDAAEKRGFSWAYWEFASSFGLYDPRTGTWVEPVRRALLD